MPENPRSLGYRMPAEWERHQATWISWPKDPDTFPPAILPKVEAAFVKIAEALGAAEEVWILVNDAKAEKHISSLMKNGEMVKFFRIRTVDVWTRDYLPTYVKGRDIAVVKWMFNAWGNKYEDLLSDEDAGNAVAASTGLTVFRPGVVMEGGGFDTDGEGTIITTEQVMLNPNRNRGFGKKGAKKVMADYLGCRRIVWLKKGIEGDDTDGHIDDIARFVSLRTVVIASEKRASDPNSRVLREDLSVLEKARDAGGEPFDVVEIPMPKAVIAKDGRLPASHLNFYIGNRSVLVPTFGGDSDRTAIHTLEGLFPQREVIGIDCRALVYGLGTIHCVTQQVPAT